jgi:hypothetical protein
MRYEVRKITGKNYTVYRTSPALITINKQNYGEIVPREAYFNTEELHFHSRSTGQQS